MAVSRILLTNVTLREALKRNSFYLEEPVFNRFLRYARSQRWSFDWASQSALQLARDLRSGHFVTPQRLMKEWNITGAGLKGLQKGERERLQKGRKEVKLRVVFGVTVFDKNDVSLLKKRARGLLPKKRAKPKRSPPRTNRLSTANEMASLTAFLNARRIAKMSQPRSPKGRSPRRLMRL
ncbi:hypothetical protein KKE06_05120 [Candidatus Micrarchaeota archaeon]|nr:hypothetical protein [Candidatus Micrarchaeota archaeon]MBU1930218.1 hypothetical protein [Candidatus Micrarchaeota archaeon]